MSEPITIEVSLSAETMAFLRCWRDQLQPNDVSPGALVELSVRIVQDLCAQGQLALSPKPLREFLERK